jgi:hypothetical protein
MKKIGLGPGRFLNINWVLTFFMKDWVEDLIEVSGFREGTNLSPRKRTLIPSMVGLWVLRFTIGVFILLSKSFEIRWF